MRLSYVAHPRGLYEFSLILPCRGLPDGVQAAQISRCQIQIRRYESKIDGIAAPQTRVSEDRAARRTQKQNHFRGYGRLKLLKQTRIGSAVTSIDRHSSMRNQKPKMEIGVWVQCSSEGCLGEPPTNSPHAVPYPRRAEG